MADDSLILILCEELLGTRKCDLIDVAIDLLGGHTNTAITHRQCLLLGIHADVNLRITQFTLELTFRRERFEFLRGINGIRHQLTQENFVIRIEEFFDYGEYILRCYSDFSVFHCYIVFVLFLFPDIYSNYVPTASVCHFGALSAVIWQRNMSSATLYARHASGALS